MCVCVSVCRHNCVLVYACYHLIFHLEIYVQQVGTRRDGSRVTLRSRPVSPSHLHQHICYYTATSIPFTAPPLHPSLPPSISPSLSLSLSPTPPHHPVFFFFDIKTFLVPNAAGEKAGAYFQCPKLIANVRIDSSALPSPFLS